MKKFISLMTASLIALSGSGAAGMILADTKDDMLKVPSGREEQTEDEEDEDNVRIGFPNTPLELGTWLEDIRAQLDVPGYWSIPEDISMTPELEEIFSSVRASGELGENDSMALAMINYQESTEDDSCNYCFLCRGSDDEGVDYYCLVFVHDDGEDNIEFCNEFDFDLQQGYEMDIAEFYLPDHPENQDLWTMPDSIDISGDLLDIYNSAISPNGLYNEPLAYMGSGEIDGMPAYCFLTTNSLYLASNNGLSLAYVVQFDDDLWVDLENSSFTIRMISECPEPSVEEEITSVYPFYTYGGWTVPESFSIEGLPEEVIDLIGEYEDGSYEPLAYVTYKEYLHPDHTALLRVVLCSVDDEYTSLVFVEEDQEGELAITGNNVIDIDATIEAGSLQPCEESPAANDWELPSSGEIPEELTDAYWQYVEEHGGYGHFGEPEYLIGVKDEGDHTSYAFICRQGLFHYRENDSIMIGVIRLDDEGNNENLEADSVCAFVEMSILAPSVSSSNISDDVLETVYNTVLHIDPQLASAIIDDSNLDGNERHANVNNIDLVITSYDTPEAARASFDSWYDVFGDDVVYSEEDYFFMDSMGDGNLFSYVFVSGNDVVVVMTSDLMQVTTVAEIGDTLAGLL